MTKHRFSKQDKEGGVRIEEGIISTHLRSDSGPSDQFTITISLKKEFNKPLSYKDFEITALDKKGASIPLLPSHPPGSATLMGNQLLMFDISPENTEKVARVEIKFKGKKHLFEF